MRPSFSMSGVVDLSALKQPAGPAGAADPNPGASAGSDAAAEAGGGFVVEAGEADFQASVLERSLRTPVVVVFSASWSDQSKQFDATLARLAEQFAGGFVLARVEAEANPRLVQAMRVPGVPAVLAIVGGELVGQFSGIRPEAEVRQWLTELLAVAQREFGMAPGAAVAGEAEPDEPPMDPALEAAYTAIEADDLDGAAQALQNVLNQDPNHPEAKPMLARVELMRRTRGADPASALARVEQSPQDVEARCTAADVLLEAGREDEALTLLLDAVRDFSGDERERARRLLLDYFELLGPQDPRVGKARARLTSLLF
ncbi:MAG TPA: tetratricopeptide repeat protein [Actinocrinis sp.]